MTQNIFRFQDVTPHATACCLLSLTLMFVHKLYQQPLDHLLSTPKKTILAGVEYIDEKYSHLRSLLSEQEGLLLEINELQKQIHVLKIEHDGLKNQLRDKLHHEGFMGKILVSPKVRIKTARLVKSVLTPLQQTITLNKGQVDGVYEGQAVLDSAGITGRVVSLTRFTSTVMLISDPSHVMNVEIERTGYRALSAGVGQVQQIDLLYIKEDAELHIGDKVVVSSLDMTYPRGYPVGKISNLLPDSGVGFTGVTVRPYANLGHAQEVIMVWKQVAEEVANDKITASASQP